MSICSKYVCRGWWAVPTLQMDLQNTRTTLIATGMLSIALFLLGQFLFITLFEFFEPKIGGISFQIMEQHKKIKTSVLFSITLACIPVLTLLSWRLGQIVSPNKRVASVLTILLFISTAIFLRHQAVKSYFTRVVKPIISLPDGKMFNYPIDPVNFVYYIFVGFCIGCIASIFIYRQQKA